MKKLNLKFTAFIQSHWIGFYFLCMFAIAFTINLGMCAPIVSFNPSLEANDWLGFWGGYLGGAIGCLPALAAYRHSIDESKRQHEEFQEQLQESRRQSDTQYENMEKDRHLTHLPVMDNHLTLLKSISDLSLLSCPPIQVLYEQLPGTTGHYIRTPSQSELHRIFEKDDHDIILLNVRNIGHGPALSIRLFCETASSVSIGALGEKDSYTFIFCLARSNNRSYHFKFSYSDMLGWNYQQSQDFQISGGRIFSSPIHSPKRVD